MLPPDLHVLGLPPAFNLSHDQTLQFKICLICFHSGSHAQRINNCLFVMNLLSVTLQDFLYRKIRSCECPHRLSDSIVKEQCVLALATNARWRILRFPLSESMLISASLLFSPLRCDLVHSAVSMEAHYRAPISLHNHFFDLFFRSCVFQPLR
ncbi:hypothetical protein Bresa_00424|nr:hypothetical protein [Brenneria salicis ATCC 15712 = DSM 30166]